MIEKNILPWQSGNVGLWGWRKQEKDETKQQILS
jgi:hypothetical protein